ncbi:hypothetical protein C8R45DRAFT_1074420 [Mycena sanguinolenta]|nr:hypothetical protein C8R45DRAFT_1074420 [Mycena sanguinolenta]
MYIHSDFLKFRGLKAIEAPALLVAKGGTTEKPHSVLRSCGKATEMCAECHVQIYGQGQQSSESRRSCTCIAIFDTVPQTEWSREQFFILSINMNVRSINMNILSINMTLTSSLILHATCVDFRYGQRDFVQTFPPFKPRLIQISGKNPRRGTLKLSAAYHYPVYDASHHICLTPENGSDHPFNLSSSKIRYSLQRIRGGLIVSKSKLLGCYVRVRDRTEFGSDNPGICQKIFMPTIHPTCPWLHGGQFARYKYPSRARKKFDIMILPSTPYVLVPCGTSPGLEAIHSVDPCVSGQDDCPIRIRRPKIFIQSSNDLKRFDSEPLKWLMYSINEE